MGWSVVCGVATVVIITMISHVKGMSKCRDRAIFKASQGSLTSQVRDRNRSDIDIEIVQVALVNKSLLE